MSRQSSGQPAGYGNAGVPNDQHQNGTGGWLAPRFKVDVIIVGLEPTLSPSLISRKVAVSRQLVP